MHIQGRDLTRWQGCRRRYAIESKYQYLPWNPRHLFAHVIRPAIFDLSNGDDPEQLSNEAVRLFMSYARKPGLDTPPGTDTYRLAMDFCATIRTLIQYLSRETLLTLHRPKPQPIGAHTWHFDTWMSDDGILHRWVFTDSISTDNLYHNSRSWTMTGDMMLRESPATLHMVAIGRILNSRLQSSWCRAYANPTIYGNYKFQKRAGGQLTNNWKPTWYADNHSSDPKTWVDAMVADEIIPKVLQRFNLPAPRETHVAVFRRGVEYEVKQIETADLVDPFSLPMTPKSCDHCPHQVVCYSPKPDRFTLEKSGAYEKLTMVPA